MLRQQEEAYFQCILHRLSDGTSGGGFAKLLVVDWRGGEDRAVSGNNAKPEERDAAASDVWELVQAVAGGRVEPPTVRRAETPPASGGEVVGEHGLRRLIEAGVTTGGWDGLSQDRNTISSNTPAFWLPLPS
jgi:hypothetical protein